MRGRVILVGLVLSVSRMQKQFHMYFLANPGGTMIIVCKKKSKHTDTNELQWEYQLITLLVPCMPTRPEKQQGLNRISAW